MLPGKKIILFQDIRCLSLVITSVLFLAFFSFFTPRFMVNDDVKMMMIVSGFLTGTPDEHMIFTNVIIGKTLKHLYSVSPDFNWYSSYLLATYYISTIFLLYSLLSLKSSKYRVFLFVIGFIISEFYMLLYPTFTTASATAALAGIFLLLTCSINRQSTASIISGIFLLVLSGMIRPDSLYMLLVLALPLILWISWEKKSLKLIFFLGIAILIVFTTTLFNKFYYQQDKHWAYHFNHTKIQLHQDPKFIYTDQTKPLFDKIDWSKIDYLMFKNWFLEDIEIYSNDKLLALTNGFPFRIYPSEYIDHFLRVFFNLKYYLICNSILFGLCWILIPKSNRKYVFFSLVSSSFTIIYILLTYYLPPQGFVPIVFLISFTSIYFATDETLKSANYLKSLNFAGKIFSNKKAITSIFIIISCFWLWQLQNKSMKNKINQDSLTQLIKAISPQKDNLYLLWWPAFPYEYISPYSNLRELDHFKIYPLGYFAHSPISHSIFKKYNIDNLFKAIYQKDNILLMSSFSNLSLLQAFIKEHYDAEIYFVPLFEYYSRGKMGIYKALKNNNT